MRAVLIALMRRRHHIGIVRDLSFRWITLELPNWSSWSSQCRSRCGVSQADSAEETTLPVTGGLNSVRTDRGRRHCIASHRIASHRIALHCSQDRHCAGLPVGLLPRCAALPAGRRRGCPHASVWGTSGVAVTAAMRSWSWWGCCYIARPKSGELGRYLRGTVIVKSICPSRKCSDVSRSLRRWPKKERGPNVSSELPAFGAY